MWFLTLTFILSTEFNILEKVLDKIVVSIAVCFYFHRVHNMCHDEGQ